MAPSVRRYLRHRPFCPPQVLSSSKEGGQRSRDSPLREARTGCLPLGHEASLVKFDPSGERFFMVVNSKVGVHQSEDSKLLLELDNGSRKRILCASPGDSGILFTAGEDRAITAPDTNSGKLAYSEVRCGFVTLPTSILHGASILELRACIHLER
ncbi:p21-activated protein kinase-interacting protein 1-like [Raphanus sativus]|nr:p21-activated protein kinase-interacting protein 1-like [Raphanus sativus]